MAVKMPLGLRIAIIDRAFRRKMDEMGRRNRNYCRPASGIRRSQSDGR